MEIAIQVLSILTMCVMVLTFGIVMTRIINMMNIAEKLQDEIRELIVLKAEEIEIRDSVSIFLPKNSFGSYTHTTKLMKKN